MVRVAGYGTFECEGTESEAEAMRQHKSRWEGGAAMKWRKDGKNLSDRVAAEIAAIFDSGAGVSAALLKKWRKALAMEKAAAKRVVRFYGKRSTFSS
jgi:hypothetical protein